MKRLRLFQVGALFMLIFMVACSGRNTKDISCYLPGNWVCNVNDGAFNGTDTLFLSGDSAFRESKSLLYSAKDSGFEFSVGVQTGMRGRWNLSGDTLEIIYDRSSMDIFVDSRSFSLKATDRNADAGKLDEIKDRMYEDLKEYLTILLQDEYSSLPSGKIILGKIEHVDADNLLLEMRGNRILMARCR